MSNFKQYLSEVKTTNHIDNLKDAYYRGDAYEVYELLDGAFSGDLKGAAEEFESIGLDVPKERTIFKKATEVLNGSKLGKYL